MKKNKGVFIVIGIVLVIIVFCIIYYFSERTHYNDENADGSIPGNIYNNGLFCQLDDKIYFSNLADDGTLYSMDTDMTTYDKLCTDKVNFINACGKYIVYNRINNEKENGHGSALVFINVGVYRIHLDGQRMIRLDKSPSTSVHQYGNDIYYLRYGSDDAYSLYSVGLDGENGKQVLKEPVSSAMITDQYIYYTGVSQDHNIYRLLKTSNQKELIKEGSYSQVILQDSYMYCINNADNYSIVRMNLDGTSESTLVSDRVSTYNITADGNYLFYQADGGDHNGIYVVNLSTGESNLVQAGNYQNLCLTEDYLFFNEFDADSMYYVSLNNPTVARSFKPKIE